MLRTVRATRYVTPLREGGSLPGIVEADDDGLYVLKFRGAGQGPLALVAEVLAGEIGRRIGLPVPEIVLVQLDPALGAAEPDPDVRDLIDKSGGTNLGMDFLPGSLGFRPGVGPPPDGALAAAVVWFDALVTNPDRTTRNPNILVWHGRQWLIDHGAALYVHHTWRDVDRHARQPFERSRDHILLPYADSIAEADERLAPELTPKVLDSIVEMVPEAWLGDDALSRRTIHTPDEQRRAYVKYLSRRLEAPRAFAEEAERVRVEARTPASGGGRRG
jgi:hypothetical protein